MQKKFWVNTKAIYAHLDEGHEHVVTDKDHEKGKYLDVPEGKTIMIWNYHAHYIFDWTDHNTGQCINLNRHDMSELQDMLANTFKMERGKKSDKKWRDAQTYKTEQEAIRTKEVAEFTERKKAESKQVIEAIKENSNKLTKLQKAIDDLLSATSVPEESLNPVSETDRKTAASSIAAMAEETIGPIYQFMWDTAVLRVGQLASEMRVSMGGQSVGGSNGRSAQRDACPSKNADVIGMPVLGI